MKTLFKILPVILVLVVLGGAIFYVTSNSPTPNVASSDETAAPVARSNGAPMSDRYSTGS